MNPRDGNSLRQALRNEGLVPEQPMGLASITSVYNRSQMCDKPSKVLQYRNLQWRPARTKGSSCFIPLELKVLIYAYCNCDPNK